MIIFYIVIEVMVLLAIIVVPLTVPRKKIKQKKAVKEISNIAINKRGYLEYYVVEPDKKGLVH